MLVVVVVDGSLDNYLGSYVRFDVVFFFFSSRRRHTRLQGDWSSDVCSSDLIAFVAAFEDAVMGRWCQQHIVSERSLRIGVRRRKHRGGAGVDEPLHLPLQLRSEERRVGKECRSRWSPYH